MKKLIIGLSIVTLLAFGAIAFAQGPGGWQGGHMMGPGYGGHMGGWASQGYGTIQTDQKFLDETVEMRKELHNKKFEYLEATRNPDISREDLVRLEREIYELQGKVHEKSPSRNFAGYGPGPCWQ